MDAEIVTQVLGAQVSDRVWGGGRDLRVYERNGRSGPGRVPPHRRLQGGLNCKLATRHSPSLPEGVRRAGPARDQRGAAAVLTGGPQGFSPALRAAQQGPNKLCRVLRGQVTDVCKYGDGMPSQRRIDIVPRISHSAQDEIFFSHLTSSRTYPLLSAYPPNQTERDGLVQPRPKPKRHPARSPPPCTSDVAPRPTTTPFPTPQAEGRGSPVGL